MAKVAGVFFAILVWIAPAGGALACSVAEVAGSDRLIRPEVGIDQRLIDATIRAEVNYHRCKAGRGPLSGSPALAGIAETHAKWMARAQTVSHKSRVAGQSTLKARMKRSGVRFRAASENIGMVQRFALEGGPFRIRSESACRFETSGGKPVGAHTYASLAKFIVNMWATSKGHRENLLDRRVSMVGSGAGFAARAPYCGRFFLSQNFAG